MRTFVRVVERGSFSSVARELGLGQPAVSKQIAALEADLGAELIRRTSRRMALTDAGQDFYEAALRLLDDFDAAASRLGWGQSAPSGLVRITVAPVFGDRLITPRLGDFFRRYPSVSVQFIVTEKLVDVIEEGVDLCIYNGEVVQPELIARKVAMASVVTVATPAYLAARGTPRSVAELEAHDGVGFSPEGAAAMDLRRRPGPRAARPVPKPRRRPDPRRRPRRARPRAHAEMAVRRRPGRRASGRGAGRVRAAADPGQPGLLHPATADQGEGVGRLPRRGHPRPSRPALTTPIPIELM
jgi:DNA-binding transcriptional LysR family regulator